MISKKELVFQIALSDVGKKIKTMTRLKIGEGIAFNVAIWHQQSN
jgi:hypothetical protein